MKKICCLLLVLFVYMSTTYAATRPSSPRDAWSCEVLSDLDKAYGMYLDMPWKHFNIFFYNLGWKREFWTYPATKLPPSYVLRDGFREIEVHTVNGHKIASINVSFYTDQRLVADQLFQDALKFLKNFSNLKEMSSVSYVGNGGAYEFENKEKKRRYIIELRDIKQPVEAQVLQQIKGRTARNERYKVSFVRCF